MLPGQLPPPPPQQQLLLPLLLPLRLLLFGSVAGNEGGTIGSCWCPRKLAKEPLIVRTLPNKLVSWEVCGEFTRFTFPKLQFCGLSRDPWVIAFKDSEPHKRKGTAPAEAAEGGPLPTPGSPASPLPAQISRGPGGPAMEDALATWMATETSTAAVDRWPTVTWWLWESSPAVGGVRPSHFPQQAGVPAHSMKTAVLGLLGMTLLSIAVAVGTVCWRKRHSPRTHLAALLPPGASDIFSGQDEDQDGA